MIQDIGPDRLENAYAPYTPKAEDKLLLFDRDGKLLVRTQDHLRPNQRDIIVQRLDGCAVHGDEAFLISAVAADHPGADG